MFLFRSYRPALTALLTAALALPATDTEADLFGKKKRKKHEKQQQQAKEILAENYVPGEGWEAYFRDEKGRTFQLIQPVEKNKDKEWMGLLFTDYSGPKLRLAVMEVENKIASGELTPNLQTLLFGQRTKEVPVGSIEELMTTALFNTNRFELVERKALSTIFGEQDLGDSGRISEQTKAKIGVALGADYMILSSVNEWTPEKSKTGGGGGGVAGRVLGGVGAGKKKAEVAMSFRVVDSTSGSVLFSTTERATAGSWGIGLGGGGGGFGGLLGYSKNSPINYAVHSCVNKGVYKLAMWLSDRAESKDWSWSGSVMKVAGQKVYINAGSDKGLEAGMTLTALSKGEELVDPDTGLVLGAETEVIGSLMVTTVNAAYSIATIVQGCQGIQAGDKVEMESSDYGAKAEAQPQVSADAATAGE